MLNFFERLDKFMIHKGLNDNKFTLECGLSNGIIGKARIRGALSQENISKILYRYPELNANWLFSGEGDMLIEDKSEAQMTSSSERLSENGVNYRSNKDIVLVSIEAIAGFGSSDFAIQDQDIQALYKVPDFNNIDFMIRVKGNSMYPKYSSGDVVACRILRDSKFIEWNKPHLISTTEHGLLVKRIRKSNDKDCITAISDNKEYDPFDIPMNEVTGIAIIIGVIRLE
jgi:repressor LexA